MGGVEESEEFYHKYVQLISGLDEKSIDTVIRIINRCRYVRKNVLERGIKAIDLYTIQEQEEILFLKDNFYSLIIELSKNCF